MPEIDSTQDIPQVPIRPEVLDIMRALGTGALDVEQAYQKLRSIIVEYLPAAAPSRQGHIVAILISSALFASTPLPKLSVGAAQGMQRRSPEEVRLRLRNPWYEAQKEAVSALAADRGIGTLIAEVMLNCMEPIIPKAFELLQSEKLSVIFPEPVIIR
ncbi:MAG TPA: hypothetical protein VFE47_23300 [Tepidisphaeraceae bacterium]|jgi:hypothetical protein|nr:hypothetical protein [Tepidisphaeraceae bacterium]